MTVTARPLVGREQYGLFVVAGQEPCWSRFCCTWRGCGELATHEVLRDVPGRRRPRRSLYCPHHAERAATEEAS